MCAFAYINSKFIHGIFVVSLISHLFGVVDSNFCQYEYEQLRQYIMHVQEL